PTPVTYTLSLHDALPICLAAAGPATQSSCPFSRSKPTRELFSDLANSQICCATSASPKRGTAMTDREKILTALREKPMKVFDIIDRKSTRLNSSHVAISY